MSGFFECCKKVYRGSVVINTLLSKKVIRCYRGGGLNTFIVQKYCGGRFLGTFAEESGIFARMLQFGMGMDAGT